MFQELLLFTHISRLLHIFTPITRIHHVSGLAAEEASAAQEAAEDGGELGRHRHREDAPGEEDLE